MIHFHVHSSYSHDGFGDVSDFLHHVGDKPFVITEHDNINSYLKLRKAGLNAYAGVELTVSGGGHITLVAKNERGYWFINYLLQIQPQHRFPNAVLCSQDVIYLSGDAHTPYNTERKLYEFWTECTTKGLDMVIEVPVVPHCEELRELLLSFAQKHNLPFILTNDVHFLSKESWLACDVSRCIQNRWLFTDESRPRHDTSLYFMEEDEFVQKCIDYGLERQVVYRAFDYAEETLSRCYNGVPVLPSLSLYKGKFIDYVLQNRYREVPAGAMPRLQKECELITRKGYSTLFILAHQVCELFRKAGIITSYGRGSSAASLCAYVLGITHVNPILYDLPVERFMSESRDDMPDFDIDVPAKYHTEAVRLIRQKFGKNMRELASHTRYTPKATWQEVFRVFGHSMRLRKEVQQIVNELVGKPCGKSISHPSGLCFGQDVASRFALLDGEDCGFLQLPRLDVLSVGALDILQEAKDRDGWDALTQLPSDVLYQQELDATSENTAAVFQIDGAVSEEVIKMMNPRTVYEMAVALALSRNPRAMVSKEPPKVLKWLYPETNGIVIFQEQLMQLFRQISPQASEEVRYAISKRDKEKLLNLIQLFKEKVCHEWNEGEQKEVLQSILSTADYLFNKAHAVAYAHLTCALLHLKKKMRAKFVAYAINAIRDAVSIAKLIIEARKNGVQVVLPQLTRFAEYLKHGNAQAYAVGNTVYLTHNVLHLSGNLSDEQIVEAYAQKLYSARKTFPFYPFHLHSAIARYRQRYAYVPLSKVNRVGITVGYVLQLEQQKCVITDGDAVRTFTVENGSALESVRCNHKTGKAVVLKIRDGIVVEAKTLESLYIKEG